MSSSTAANRNPFLSDDEDNSYWVKTKCRMPNCDEDTAQGHLACLFHLQSSISPKAPKSLEGHLAQASSQPTDPRPDVGPSPSRKNVLDAKFILRKSAAPGRQPRPPFHPAESRMNYSFTSVHDRLAKSQTKSSLQRPLDPPLLDNPARKRQRILSPRNDGVVFNPVASASASPLAFPSAFLSQNGNLSMPQPAKLPTLNGDTPSFSPGNSKAQERPATVYSSYGDYLKTPINDVLGVDSSIASSQLNGNTARSVQPGPGPRPRSNSKRESLDRIQRQTTTPSLVVSPKSTPSKSKSSHTKISPSQPVKPTVVALTPPLEQQRRRLAEQDTSILDAFVYGQQCSSQPPPDVDRRHDLPEPKQQDDVFYAHIDPRIHRSRPHSEEWYQKKEAEIKARGGRKANFGKAVQRMKEQRLKKGPDDFETTLPDRVRHNEQWVSALRWFEAGGQESPAVEQSVASASPPAPVMPATPVRTKRPYVRRKPFVPRGAERRAAGQDP